MSTSLFRPAAVPRSCFSSDLTRFREFFRLAPSLAALLGAARSSPARSFYSSPSCANPTCTGGGGAAGRCFTADVPSLQGGKSNKRCSFIYFILYIHFFSTPPRGKGAVCCQPDASCYRRLPKARGAAVSCLIKAGGGIFSQGFALAPLRHRRYSKRWACPPPPTPQGSFRKGRSEIKLLMVKETVLRFLSGERWFRHSGLWVGEDRDDFCHPRWVVFL